MREPHPVLVFVASVVMLSVHVGPGPGQTSGCDCGETLPLGGGPVQRGGTSLGKESQSSPCMKSEAVLASGDLRKVIFSEAS